MSDRFGGGISRRRLLGAAGAAGLGAAGLAGLAACDAGQRDGGDSGGGHGGPPGTVDAPPPVDVLGVNFNSDATVVRFDEMRAVKATWVRGFLPMRPAQGGDPTTDPVVKTILSAAGQGYGTVLSLKFPFNERPFPAAGGGAMATQLAHLDKVLAAVLNRVDILAIGNEPFIESRPAQRGAPLNAFYEHVARHVIDYRAKHGGKKTRLYMGALNHLDDPSARTPAVDRWMRFAHATPEIEGVDIHPHVAAPGDGQRYLDYILPRLRKDQRFLVTEFSMVQFWKKHLTDPAPAAYVDRYPAARGAPVWRVIRNAIERPFPQRRWDDFLTALPPFHANRDYLTTEVQRYRRTGKLAVATYGLTQGAAMLKDFTAKKPPWLLNSLFCPGTVRPEPGGLPGRNTTWTREFEALQHT